MKKYLHLILIIPALLLLFGSFNADTVFNPTVGSVMRTCGYALMIVAVFLSFRQK